MRKILLYFFVVTLCLFCVSAAQMTMPVEVDVSVDFEGNRDFKLLLPQGYERHFSWEANETHSDTSIKHTIYHKFNDSEWCPVLDEQRNQYETISSDLSKMLSICGDVMGSVNKSYEYSQQLETCRSSESEYKLFWEVCEDKRKTAENKSVKLDDVEDELSSCQSALSAAKAKPTYKTELDDCEKSRTNWSLVMLGVGLGLGYFMWGRKPKPGPSEQAEAGNVTDDVVYDGPTQ